jgi:hypothetical protein
MPFGPGTYPAGDPRNNPAQQQGTMAPMRLGAPMQAPVRQAMPGAGMVPQRPLNQPMPQTAPMGPGTGAVGPGMTPETQMLRAPAPQAALSSQPQRGGFRGQMEAARQLLANRPGRSGGKSARAPGQFMQQSR